MSEPKITLDDVVKAGHCVRGAKEWFVGKGFDWHEVVRNGVAESDLLATGDGLALRVIEAKRAREHG